MMTNTNKNQKMARQMQTSFFASGLIDSQVIACNVQGLKAVRSVLDEEFDQSLEIVIPKVVEGGI